MCVFPQPQRCSALAADFFLGGGPGTNFHKNVSKMSLQKLRSKILPNCFKMHPQMEAKIIQNWPTTGSKNTSQKIIEKMPFFKVRNPPKWGSRLDGSTVFTKSGSPKKCLKIIEIRPQNGPKIIEIVIPKLHQKTKSKKLAKMSEKYRPKGSKMASQSVKIPTWSLPRSPPPASRHPRGHI